MGFSPELFPFTSSDYFDSHRQGPRATGPGPPGGPVYWRGQVFC